MKPFDLQRALDGDPLVTRDGRLVVVFLKIPQSTRVSCRFKYEAYILDDPKHKTYNERGEHLIIEQSPLDLFMKY